MRNMSLVYAGLIYHKHGEADGTVKHVLHRFVPQKNTDCYVKFCPINHGLWIVVMKIGLFGSKPWELFSTQTDSLNTTQNP